MSKKYFTFFGILIATVKKKIQSFNAMIDSILIKEIPKIIKLLYQKVLKPIKQYSTNNI